MRLATEGYGLVTGGWSEVDETVARAFWETVSERGLAPEDRLIQVIVKNDQPAFAAGELVFVRKGEEDWSEPIQRANAVLLLGGLGGTWTTGEMALGMHKPVLPLADTGGGRGSPRALGCETFSTQDGSSALVIAEEDCPCCNPLEQYAQPKGSPITTCHIADDP
jgi:hypothetical protein